ncbi:MAG: hypothetical protein K6B72_07460 [Lachnospiraceae bacterium]|nr:hypothetical protein [Lachnospiraceae bacterium]
MLGRAKCKILKEIRQTIADENDIPYVTSECMYQGDCSGTCPRCERELAYLESELEKRQRLGKTVAVSALCAGITFGTAACAEIGPGDDLAGAPEIMDPPVVEELAGEAEVVDPSPVERGGNTEVDGYMEEINPPDVPDVCPANIRTAEYDIEDAPVFWSNFNTSGVLNYPENTPTFTVEDGQTLHVKYLTTYHWNGGSGSCPGNIYLFKDGEQVGEWEAYGRSGQATYWDAIVDTDLEPGEYKIMDSSPETWSCNSQSGETGFAEVRGDL